MSKIRKIINAPVKRAICSECGRVPCVIKLDWDMSLTAWVRTLYICDTLWCIRFGEKLYESDGSLSYRTIKRHARRKHVTIKI